MFLTEVNDWTAPSGPKIGKHKIGGRLEAQESEIFKQLMGFWKKKHLCPHEGKYFTLKIISLSLYATNQGKISKLFYKKTFYIETNG